MNGADRNPRASWRRTIRYGAAVILMAGVAGVVAGLVSRGDETPSAEPDVPRMACAARVHDFGERAASETVTHTFILRNTGTAPLVITKVRAGCGCTTTSLDSKTLAPGETTDLEVRFKLKGRRGKQSSAVYVHSNDPNERVYRLEMKGVVESGGTDAGQPPPRGHTVQIRVEPGKVTVTPETLALGDVLEDQSTTGDIMLSIKEPDTVGVPTVTTDQPDRLRTEVDPLIEGQSYRIKVTLIPPLTPGPFAGVVRINADHPGLDDWAIPVSSVVRNDLYPVPKELVIVLDDKPPRPVSRHIVVRSLSKKAVTIGSVQTPGFQAKTTSRAMSSKKGALVTVSELVPAPELNGKEIVIRTSAPRERELRVPIRVTDRRTAP